MKICGTCKIEKPSGEFSSNTSRADGLQSLCKTCKKEYNKQHHQTTKEKFNPSRFERRDLIRNENRQLLVEYLLTHPCVDCGETDIVVLEFDHLRDKKSHISTMIAHGKSWVQILDEISKCEVVCANDHKRRTARSFNWFKLTVNPS